MLLLHVNSNKKLWGGVCKRLCGGVQAAMWWGESGYVVGCKQLCGGVQAAVWWVAHKILVSAPGPFGL